MNNMTTPPYLETLFKTIGEIGLSEHVVNCLSQKEANIMYVSDLVRKSGEDLRCIPQFGRKALTEVHHVLFKMGLHLGMNIPEMTDLDRADNREEYLKRCKRAGRIRKIHRQYGLTVEDVEKLLTEQGGKCAICQKEDIHLNGGYGPAVDHDHKTGKFRGILCNGCNTGLGSFKDDPESLIRAAEYLRERASENWIGNQREPTLNPKLRPRSGMSDRERSEWWLKRKEEKLQRALHWDQLWRASEKGKMNSLRRRKLHKINVYWFRQKNLKKNRNAVARHIAMAASEEV